ncbi:MAG: hypothetical protein IJU78_06770 [Clostridia bacterium]|nr:hypothetical protein [Clostridia bacterium]
MSRFFENIIPRSHIMRRSMEIYGQHVEYELAAEDMIIDGKDGGAAFAFFCWSYIRRDVPDSISRPVLFAFNGGPTASSTWLHLGFYGPRILRLQPDGMPPSAPPYELRDNPDCLLDICDLVLIDPVNTGFSRLLDEKYAGEFTGDHQDAHSVSLFIRAWLQKHGRAASPKFFSGESFGSTRASLLAWYLKDLQPVCGIVHIGPGYSSDSEALRTFKDLPPAAATHWYYNDAPDKGSLSDFLAECYDFMYGEYVSAMYRGTQLPQEERAKIAAKLEYFTGLSAQYYLEHGLLVSRADFRNMRLAGKGLKLGSYDSRFTLPLSEDADPFAAAYDPPMAGCREAYFAEIGLDMPRRYRAGSYEDDPDWSWFYSASPGIVGMGDYGISMAGAAAGAFKANPNMRFFFGTGVYDTVATIENTRYSVTHTDIPISCVVLKEYESGHAVYADDASRALLAKDVRAFITDTLKQNL